MDELKGLRNPNVAPYSIEKLATSIKTDTSRILLGVYQPWPEDVPYNVSLDGVEPSSGSTE